MDISTRISMTRLGAYSSILAALLMITGAVLKVTSGADLDVALTTGSPAEYLGKLMDVRHLLVINLSFWVAGIFFLGIAGSTMAKLCERRPTTASIIKLGYFTGVPLAIVSFVAWLALVVQLSPNASPAETKIFEVIGWFISRADWTATILVVGVGPAMISYAGLAGSLRHITGHCKCTNSCCHVYRRPDFLWFCHCTYWTALDDSRRNCAFSTFRIIPI